MDKKLLALLILGESQPGRGDINQNSRRVWGYCSGTAGVYRGLFFRGKSLGKYYAMVNLDTVTFLDPASLYNKLELDVDDQKIAHIVKEKIIAAASSPR